MSKAASNGNIVGWTLIAGAALALGNACWEMGYSQGDHDRGLSDAEAAVRAAAVERLSCPANLIHTSIDADRGLALASGCGVGDIFVRRPNGSWERFVTG
jgi:hypothetical protein